MNFLPAGSYKSGQLEISTDNGIKNLQRKLSEYGKNLSSGIGGDYGTSSGPGMKAGDVGASFIIKPDGCYGPKTSCAVTLFYGLPDIYGRSKNKCMSKLGLSKKAASTVEKQSQAQLSPETWAERGLGAAGKFLKGDFTGAKAELGKNAQELAGEKTKKAGLKKESKNWIAKTREETLSNLFERLVKDSSKKVN